MSKAGERERLIPQAIGAQAIAPASKVDQMHLDDFYNAVRGADRIIVETRNALGEFDSHIFQAANIKRFLVGTADDQD